MDASAIGGHDPGFAEHLTEDDVRLLLSVAGDMRDRGIETLLGDPRVFGAVFGRAGTAIGQMPVSPFLAFAVAVQRAAADLSALDHLPERSGMRQRIPVFDTPQLRDFLSSAERRLFLTELLASAPGGPGGRSGRRAGARPRARRYSELDPVRLAGLLDAVPEESRPGVYRRLGDVSLFLTGVFPDYSTAIGPVDVSRLLRIARVPAGDRDGLASAPVLDLLEYLGARWYRAALNLAPVRTTRLDVVGEVADRFRHARRILNHLADRYLLGPDSPWFAAPS
jgi:hypothetical protein